VKIHLVIFLLLAASVAAHLSSSDLNQIVHHVTIPLLLVPVAYFAAAFNTRGVIVSALFAALVLADDFYDGSAIHLLIELAVLLAIVSAGAAFGTLLARENQALSSVRNRETDRRLRLTGLPKYWDDVASTQAGLYVTAAESSFIKECLRTAAPGAVLDIGAGTGRLAPAILEHSRAVVATEVDAEAIAAMDASSGVQALRVSAASPALPFADQSFDWIVCFEVPGVSDEDWFRRECGRVLRPGGGVVMTVHNAASYKALWRRMPGISTESSVYYRHALSWHRRRWREAGFRERARLGFYWLPSSRASDSQTVPAFAAAERLLGLRHLAWFSPWVLFHVQLPGSAGQPD
jgi:SAM-dependent methyltransferase